MYQKSSNLYAWEQLAEEHSYRIRSIYLCGQKSCLIQCECGCWTTAESDVCDFCRDATRNRDKWTIKEKPSVLYRPDLIYSEKAINQE